MWERAGAESCGLRGEGPAALGRVVPGLLLQVSKARGSKFQAAFRRQEQHPQVPAVSFDSLATTGLWRSGVV